MFGWQTVWSAEPYLVLISPGRMVRERTLFAVSVLQRRADEAAEQRVRTVGTRLELGVVLNADVEGPVGQLDGLDEATVRGEPGEGEPGV